MPGRERGDLRSLEAVLSKLPTSFPWPILVSQHLQREHASLMPGILSRRSSSYAKRRRARRLPRASSTPAQASRSSGSRPRAGSPFALQLAALNEEFLSTNQDLASTNAGMQASIDHAPPGREAAPRDPALAQGRDRRLRCAATRDVHDSRGFEPSGLGPRRPRSAARRPARWGSPPRRSTDGSTLPPQGGGPRRAQRSDLRRPPAGAHRRSHGGPDGSSLGWLLTWSAHEAACLPDA